MPNPIRRFFQTTECYACGLSLAGLNFCRFESDILWCFAVALCSCGYTLARTIHKKNRGLFQSGLFSSEFFFTLTAAGSLWGRAVLKSISPDPGYFAAALCLVFYSVCRGFVKGIGTKTQVVLR